MTGCSNVASGWATSRVQSSLRSCQRSDRHVAKSAHQFALARTLTVNMAVDTHGPGERGGRINSLWRPASRRSDPHAMAVKGKSTNPSMTRCRARHRAPDGSDVYAKCCGDLVNPERSTTLFWAPTQFDGVVGDAHRSPGSGVIAAAVRLIAAGERQVINECVQAGGFGCYPPHHALPLTSAEPATPPPVYWAKPWITLSGLSTKSHNPGKAPAKGRNAAHRKAGQG
jgi:hypothetical protein